MVTTYLVTGASSGIGLNLVRQLSARDDTKIYATCRKRTSSQTGDDALSELMNVGSSNITILEDIDVASDNVGSNLVKALTDEGVKEIDVVIHNAGSLAGGSINTRTNEENSMEHQKFENVTMDRMRMAFEVNTLGPLRVQQAISSSSSSPPLMKSPGGKVAIISTGLASIDDNTSSGMYSYRVSKAGVNMVTKCMSVDFKEKDIAVMAIAPGFVATEFGPGKETMEKWGAMPVDMSVRGIMKLIDSMSMENTGKFYGVQKDDTDAKEMSW